PSGDQRGKVLIRDLVVLGATGIGTILATKKFMPLPTLKDGMEEVAQLGETLKEYGKKYADLLELDAFKNARTHLSREEFEKVVSTIKSRGGNAELDEILPVGADLTEIKGFRAQLHDMIRRAGQKDSAGKIMDDDGELVAMIRFFTVGLASVLSGLTGGIIANKINKVKDPNATANMAKEGCFQFIANIALCAVGASIALILMKIPAVAKQIGKLGALAKLVRTVGIMVGLSLGIFGGGIIANKLGQRYINPLIDRMNGRSPEESAKTAGGKRKIEFADAILHLDDLPTALALAGFAAVEPILPWFFAFSGYRTGIGYRNDEESKHNKKQPQLAAPMPTQAAFSAFPPTFPAASPTQTAQPFSLPQAFSPFQSLSPNQGTMPYQIS
ncbi:MAG TPA: hypothetical protein V6C99_02985, partial [Oculatellaceae cyanobacterium]